MMTSLFLAAALAAQEPAKDRPPAADATKAAAAKPARKADKASERRREARRIQALLEGKASRPVTPGEILFVGPPPGDSTVVALTPKKGVQQMVDLLTPFPGNQLYAANEVKNFQEEAAKGHIISRLEYDYALVPFKVRAVGTSMYEAPVCELYPARVGQAMPRSIRMTINGVHINTVWTIPIPVTQVMPLEGPLKGRPLWVLHANFYVLDKKAADLSYEDRVKLWESLLKRPARSKSRARRVDRPGKDARPKAK